MPEVFDRIVESRALVPKPHRHLLIGLDAIAYFKSKLGTVKDDAISGCLLSKMMRIISELGFEQVLDLDFEIPGPIMDEIQEEHFYIYAHPDGMIIVFDTYLNTHVKGGCIYFNLQLNEDITHFDLTRLVGASGELSNKVPNVFSGYVSLNTTFGIRETITVLKSNGTILQTWIDRLFLWFLHSRDLEGDFGDHQRITNARLLLLPMWVQKIVTPDLTIESRVLICEMQAEGVFHVSSGCDQESERNRGVGQEFG